MEQFWNCHKVDGRYAAEDPISGAERWSYFEKKLWFELVNSIWKKHWSLFMVHLKYIHNYIVKPFSVVIIQYDERVC